MTTVETAAELSAEQMKSETWVPRLDFGARLALVRQRMGWNVKEAAKECGVPAQSWRGWEVSGREPHNRNTIALAIATRTGCDYLWLVHGPERGGAMQADGTSFTLRNDTSDLDAIDAELSALLNGPTAQPREGRLVAKIGSPRSGRTSRGQARPTPLAVTRSRLSRQNTRPVSLTARD